MSYVYISVAYKITVLNESGTPIQLTYGHVHEWWLSHQNVIISQGFIEV